MSTAYLSQSAVSLGVVGFAFVATAILLLIAQTSEMKDKELPKGFIVFYNILGNTFLVLLGILTLHPYQVGKK